MKRFAVIVCLAFLVACTEVPKPVQPAGPMYSPETGKPDSGIEKPVMVAGELWFPVLPSFQERYTALLTKYATHFTTRIDPSAGFEVHNGQLCANGYVMQNLAKMAQWERDSASTIP